MKPIQRLSLPATALLAVLDAGLTRLELVVREKLGLPVPTLAE